MESNKNNKSSNGGDQHQHQQLRGNARKRTFNELANDVDVDQPADQDQQQEPENCSKKNRGGQRENDALENIHLESLTREELIQLVRKQNEAQETTTRQAEEFSQRIVQLEQEKAEVHAEFHQKMSEIVKMHKEVEEKSEKLAEKAKEIDALLIQLKKTSHEHQIGLPTEEEIKIQLSLETWYDWLTFVPRHQLGQIVPMIGDRKFGSILQKFLHKYGEITIGDIEIVAPYEEDPSGSRPRIRLWQNHSLLRFEMAEAQMPANIKHFDNFELRYFDQSVFHFMQKFQQNGLLDNVRLCIGKLTKDIVQPVLCHLLPLIKGIVSINVEDSAQLVDIYDAANSKEIYEMNMKMMEKTRLLTLSNDFDPDNFLTNKIDLYCRWLYQTARADGKPRVLHFRRRINANADSGRISLFIDWLKQDFLMATDPVNFFIRILLPKNFQPQKDICLDNGKTKERLLTKMKEGKVLTWEVFLLISRYPQASTKKWIEENEKEVLAWDFDVLNEKTIYLCEKLKVVPI